MPALKPGPAVANGTGTAVSTSVAAGVGRAAAKATGTAVSTSIASGVGHGSTSVVVGTAVSTSSATGVGRALARTTGTAISTSIAAGIGRAMMPGSVGTAVSTSVAAGAGGRIARTTGTAVSKSVAEGSGYAAGVVVSTYRKPATVQVPDVRIVQNNQYPAYDVTLDWSLLPNGTLDDTKALATAVTIALGTNALADPSEPLPDPDSTDRGGWWGDMDAELIWNAWPIGSKLWLLRRSKIVNAGAGVGASVVLVENYIRMAMQPFVDRRICSSFEIRVARVNPQRIDAFLRIYRGPQPAIDLAYQVLWGDMS